MKLFNIILLLSILFTAISCKKDKASAELTTSEVIYYASGVTDKPILQNVSKKGEGLVLSSLPKIKWKSAQIYVNEILFEGNSNKQITSLKGVKSNINLFENNAVGKLDLPVGEYKDVTVMLNLKKSENSEPSFWLKAEFTDGTGRIIPLSIANSEEFKIKLSIAGAKVNPLKTYKAIIKYDIDKVLHGITTEDLENTYRDPNGVIGISSSVNPLLYEKVKANWQNLATATFFEN